MSLVLHQEKPLYFRVLVEFMNFMHPGENFNKATVFTQAQLLAIQPDDVKQWMCQKVFGMRDPTPDDYPTQGRSSSLEHYKKCLSYYMPNRLMQWNVATGTGNPTRSVQVNELIKWVKKLEVRKQGKASSARRAIEAPEFEQTIEILQESEDIKKKYMVTTAAKFQYAMVA